MVGGPFDPKKAAEYGAAIVCALIVFVGAIVLLAVINDPGRRDVRDCEGAWMKYIDEGIRTELLDEQWCSDHLIERRDK